VVIEMRTQENALEERYKFERSLQNVMDDKLTITKHLGRARTYKTNIAKLLRAVENSIEASTKVPTFPQVRSTSDSASILFISRSSLAMKQITQMDQKEAELERRRSETEEQKRVQEEKEIHMLASVASLKLKSNRSLSISTMSRQGTEEEKERRRSSQKKPKTIPVGQKTIREFKRSGTHRNNPRYRGRYISERRRTKRGSLFA